MIHLYCRSSGASDFELVGDGMAADKWEPLRHATATLLRTRGQDSAADRLEGMAFKLGAGTNCFGDDFNILHVTLPIKEYAGLAHLENDETARRDFRAIAEAISELGAYTRHIAIYPNVDNEEFISQPPIAGTCAAVERALLDAETLLRTAGAPHAVDRVHTALHAYLKKSCEDAQILCSADLGTTGLFKLLRKHHPSLRGQGPRQGEITKITNALASAIDSLDTLRNRASQAHPADELLGDAEAVLAINTTRTLLHYLHAKLPRSR